MAPHIALIATDLDGTLIGSATDIPFYATFGEKISALRQAYSTV